MTLSRDKILKHAGVFKPKEVHVPAWADESGDDTVLVRGMTIREFEINQASLGSGEGEATAALISRCVVDETGGRVFEDKDIPTIAELGLDEGNRIGDAILELSGMTEKSKAEVAANLEPTPDDSSSSS